MLGRFLREHWMLGVAMAAAAASMVAVPPDGAYLGYFDWKTIGCLFCVLAVASAFRRVGAFDRIARMAIVHNGNSRTLALVIVLVTAMFSMAFTNDVALVIMLPLAAAVLVELGCPRLVPIVFALQALAANLCGMVTPFGNPQNLYLYSYYHLSLEEFLGTMALPFLASLVVIVVVTMVMTGQRRGSGAVGSASDAEGTCRMLSGERGGTPGRDHRLTMPLDRRRLMAYGILFAITLLAVFRIVPFVVAVAVVAISLLFADRKALAEVDYALLATFICFFVFAGNMARIPALGIALAPLMDQWGLMVSALTSQVMSNVPAAVVLSRFTDVWRPLLVGVNVGGAGTFVGSLASLIAIRYFVLARRVFPPLRAPDAPGVGRFLLLFGVMNACFFVGLLGFCQALIGAA